jgi:hypothetical protein
MKKLNQQKIKIGIVGEHPDNDALALSYLLKNVAQADVEFIILLKNYRGSNLDSKSFVQDLKADFRRKEPQFIILLRDLDALLSDHEQLAKRDAWVKKANNAIDQKGIPFIVIYEMEALILSDIDTFNDYYKLQRKSVGDPKMMEDPKGKLKNWTEKTQKGKYTESDAVKIFPLLNFRTVYDNHKGKRSFQTFADELVNKKLIVLPKD